LQDQIIDGIAWFVSTSCSWSPVVYTGHSGWCCFSLGITL